jgi:hypothetical protein
MYINSWINSEFLDAPLADTRLENRLKILANSFYNNPGSHLPEACGSYAATEAAYRFFANKRINPEVILMGHRDSTINRMKKHETVLAIQDTTDFDYKSHPATKNLGTFATSETALGFLNHTTLAVSESGVPLGILSSEIWTRDPEEYGKSRERAKLPTKDKESNKWLNALDSSLQDIPKYTKVVTVCDREADIYDFFSKAITDGKHLLVRVQHKDRKLGDGAKLLEKIESQPVSGTIITSVPRDIENKRKPRDISLNIKYCPVSMKAPKNRTGAYLLPKLDLYLVLAQEATPIEGEEPISWLLITTIPVENLDQAVEKIRWYKQRWKIERYHHILKSGCKVEELQLEEADHLKNALAVYSVVAWKLLWVKLESEENPEASCDVVLQEHEWQALCCVTDKNPIPPEQPPTLGEAVLMIAKLGGFLGRNCDGKPGTQVIWRGLRRLHDMAFAWQVAHLPIQPKDV